jgi:uncharacterized protein YecE (DUF72 family)
VSPAETLPNVGCAEWTVPGQYAHRFPAEETHLKRYSGRFPAVEINSSFYRPHRPATYARWAAAVPGRFRFSVKVPREITHKRRLVEATGPLERFLSVVLNLGAKLGPLLIQLPPSLAFDGRTAETFDCVLTPKGCIKGRVLGGCRKTLVRGVRLEVGSKVGVRNQRRLRPPGGSVESEWKLHENAKDNDFGNVPL